MKNISQLRLCPGRRGPEYVERSLAIVCVGTFLFERFKSDTGVRLDFEVVRLLRLVVFF